jgi:tetratricopeptide (TPR) repeat protein
LKRALALLLLSSLPVAAQPLRAEPVDPALRADPGSDFFLRGVQILNEAQKSTDLENRRLLYERASEIFSRYLQDFPNHPNAEATWFYLGSAYYQSGRIEDAKRCFSTVLNRYGQGKWVSQAAWVLASDHYNKGEFAFAAPMFERFAANAGTPTDVPKGHYYAGICHRMLGRDREAIKAFRAVVEDPAGALFIAQSKLALGALLAKGGKLDEALEYYEKVVDSNHPVKFRGEAALQSALVAARLERTELSDKYLKMVLSSAGMEEFRPDAQIALMENHFAKKEFNEVIEIFRRSNLKAKDEKEAARLMVAGRAYMELKKPTEALELFREIERTVDPSNDLAFDASYFRLLCFFQIEGRHVPDQVDAFLQIYGKSRKDHRRIHTAMMLKAESLFSNGEIPAAASVFSEIDASKVGESNRPGLLYHRGWCLAEAGDAQGAVRSLSEFISNYPDDSRIPTAIAKRAKAYVEIAEPSKAIADFDRLTAEGMPADLVAMAWLESARMRRSESNIEDMTLRYRSLLQKVPNLPEKVEAEANYWIGWGMVKSNEAKDSVPFLEKARTKHPEAYAKHAGLLLALGYFAAQDPQRLAAELNLAIEGKYQSDIPDQAVQWAGMQSYNAGDYPSAARFLALVAKKDEPRETPKEVWRYLAKALLETAKPSDALEAVNHLLAVEDNPAWKADGLLDRGRALLGLKRPAEARIAADEALALNPQGRTSGGLRILTGDLEQEAGDLGKAAASYLYVIQFQDGDLKAQALRRIIELLEKQGEPAEAEKYRQQLHKEFPDRAPTTD